MSNHSQPSRRDFLRYSGAAAVALGLSSTAACSGLTGGSDSTKAAKGKTAFTVSDKPATTDKATLAQYQAALTGFAAKYPKLDFQPQQTVSTTDMLQLLPAKLASGTLPSAFSVPMASAYIPIGNNQSHDITAAVKKRSETSQVLPAAMQTVSSGSRVYGWVAEAEVLGLIYSRKMFAAAGINPDNAPATFDAFRETAARLSNPKKGAYGYATMTGVGAGWFFTMLCYAAGAQVELKGADGKWTTDLTGPKARSALQLLKDMRWTDRSLNPRLFAKTTDALAAMATGQVGMFIGPPAFTSNVITSGAGYGLKSSDVGMGVIPQGGGNGAYFDGVAYLFNPKQSDAEVDGALDWAIYQFLDPESLDAQWHALTAQGGSIPPITSSEMLLKADSSLRNDIAAVVKKYSKIPHDIFGPYIEGNKSLTPIGEPPVNSQQVYTLLGPVVEAVLTNKNADVDTELHRAASQIQSLVLAHA